MSKAEPHLLHRTEGAVGVLTLNRPNKFNCVSLELANGLQEAIERFEADRSVRVILLLASGKNFCTGADLDQVLAARRSGEELRRFIGAGHAALRGLEQSRLPVVAAVQGFCLAGGLEITMACDVVFAACSARLGCQHAQYGLVPGWGGTQRLPRLVGLRRALDLMFSARWLDAAEAQDWGLVNAVVDDEALHEQARAYAAMLATRNPDGLALMKSLARASGEESASAGLLREQALVIDALQSANVSEGLAAFQQRRTPVFK
jgi:enoyl-CoA hydratase/carnithine racemase